MLNIQYNGHNIDVTDALKLFIQEKSKKLQHHSQDLTTLVITLSVEKEQNTAEGTLSTHNKFECHAIDKSTDMYHSIDQMIDKLDKQIIKHKEKKLGHKE